jgi:hypothetical protein
MFNRKQAIVFLIILSLFNFTVLSATAQVVPVNKLSAVEIMIYGNKSDESILKRIERLEATLYKQKKEGSLIERTNNIYNYVLGNKERPSLVFNLNGLEWSLTTNITQDTALNKLNKLEKMVFGENKEGSLKERINYLTEITFSKEKVPFEKISLPKNKLIKIKTFDKVSSVSSKSGDKVRFEVVENVYVDSKLVIPAGSTGILEVSNVEKSGNLGKEGKINLKFSKVMALDGSEVKIDLNEEAQMMNRSQQLALGASILGAAVLGPVGLVAGYFVKGNEEKLPKGSEIYVQTVTNKSVYGFKFE